MKFGDTSRGGLPFAKDPSVIRFRDGYLMYYSIKGTDHLGWGIGIARSRDLEKWEKIGELTQTVAGPEAKGIAAPGAVVLEGRVHLFYQTYGHWREDALCHAVSEDGVTFKRHPGNPIFRPRGKWSAGRAIDAEALVFGDRLLLYYATRDPEMKVQKLGVASAAPGSDFCETAWTDLSVEGPLLEPVLPWEKDCIEAATVCQKDGVVYLFYAGAYNNAPQQIGVAWSTDGVKFTRLMDEPIVPVGKPGTWNASESGHPGVMLDTDGRTHLFFQGNCDNGKSWYLSRAELGWSPAPRGDGQPAGLLLPTVLKYYAE